MLGGALLVVGAFLAVAAGMAGVTDDFPVPVHPDAALPLVGALVVAFLPAHQARAGQAGRAGLVAGGARRSAVVMWLAFDAGRRPVPVPRVVPVDPGLGRALHLRRRRHRAGHAGADRAAGAAGDPGLAGTTRSSSKRSVPGLLRAAAGAGVHDDRRLRGRRRLPVLRVLRGHARADVLPHRLVRRRASGSTRR